ncbi:MAG: hypothetical protein ABR570_02105 [Burkholderiales bacterium]
MRVFLFLAAGLISASAIAAPFAVQVGEARVALDAPPGFSDVQMTGSPRLLELAEALTSASNRILLFALEDADVRRFTVGDSPLLRRYVIAVTPKGLESVRVTLAAFERLAADSLRELGEAPAAGIAFRTYLDSQSRGRPSLLAQLRKDEEVLSVLQGVRLPDAPRREPQYVLSTTTLMLIRGKALNVALYTDFSGDGDLDWIRATTERWIEELQRLNSR